ncbi:MAG: hypothetical protein KKG47_16415 [Proteobacteria bacterium]|nr:hypothetical protein [Pseudomonadota bacterium]MBU1739673.1 hypothetical protein [Pseudomonadota bacterium]
MSGFYKLLSIGLAVMVAFLLYQSKLTKGELEKLAARIDNSETTEPTAPSWDDPELQKPYPETIPQQVASLIDAFEPLDGKYDLTRIKQVMEEIDDRNLKDVLDSIDWQSDTGKALADELIKRKAIDPGMFRDTNLTFGSDSLNQIRLYCTTDLRCIELFEKCCLSLKCCFHRCCATLPCKRCCWSCWTPCCSKTIQIGMIGDPPAFKIVKKIKFQTGDTFSVEIDGTDTYLGIVTIPSGSGTGTSPLTPSDATNLLNHINTSISTNPHGTTKSDIIYGPGNLITSADINDGTITADDLGTNSVHSDEIADNAVGSGEIANGTITADDLGTDSVGSDEIALNAVGTDEINNGSITSDDLGTDSVGSDEIAADAVGTGEIANGTITIDDLGTNSVGSDEIADNAVGTGEIANGAILGEDITNSGAPTDKIQEGKINYPASPGHGHSGYAPTIHTHDGNVYKKSGATCYTVNNTYWEPASCP